MSPNKHFEIKNLSKSFEDKFVLQDINFDVSKGENLIILGGSGSGKTVLIKLMSGLLRANQGSSILFNGTEMTKFKEKDLMNFFNNISFTFQLNALFDSYTIWKNICFKDLFNSKKSKEEMIKSAGKYLKMLSLSEDILFFYPKDISGGMQKRVAIARSLINNPEVIFFDEPTSGLDPLTSQTIAEIIKECNSKNITTITITHDIKLGLSIADRILFLKDKKINWLGASKDASCNSTEELQDFIKAG